MRKQLTAAMLLMLLFAGLGSSALLTRALAQPQTLTAVQQEKRMGPKPTPSWYWRWQAWRLGVGYAKGHPHQPSLRPNQAPRLIPSWSWRRLHYFRLARLDRSPASDRKSHGHTTTTSTTTTSGTPDTTTTTGTPTTTPSGGSTYGEAISYTQTPPPFTPSRTIDVTTASEFKTALSNLQPGDLVEATAPFTVPGETIIRQRLTSPAVLDLGSYVHFYNSGVADLPAVWISNAANLRIYGGDVRSDAGNCIVWYGSQHILWWGFHAHDCGGGGIGIATLKPGENGYGPIQYDDIEGSITHFSLTGGIFDNHVEKCTGIHGANIADSNYADISHNRFAFDVEDSACSGGGISFGSNQSTNIPRDNTVILKCANFTFISTIQTGGNCYQTWGYGNQNTDIQYLEADNLTGHGYFAGGLYNKPNSYLATDAVEYGRASNVNQNPRYSSDPAWDTTGGTAFLDARMMP